MSGAQNQSTIGIHLLALLARVGIAGRRPRALGLLEANDVHVPGIGQVGVIGQQAVGLQRFHQAADLLVRDGVVTHLPGPTVHDQTGDGPVVAEQLGELGLDVRQLGGCDLTAGYPRCVVPDRVVEAWQKAATAKGRHVFRHHVALAIAPRDVLDVEITGAARPQGEAVVMPGGEHAVLHLGGHCGVGPLARIEAGGIELPDVQIRLRPEAGVGEDPEVDEHAEAQIDEFSLQFLQRLGRGGACAMSEGTLAVTGQSLCTMGTARQGQQPGKYQ